MHLRGLFKEFCDISKRSLILKFVNGRNISVNGEMYKILRLWAFLLSGSLPNWIDCSDCAISKLPPIQSQILQKAKKRCTIVVPTVFLHQLLFGGCL